MNKKVEKTLVAALSAAMGAGLVAPVVQAAETSNLNALYKTAYDATVKAQTSKTQKDLTEARVALDAFMKVVPKELRSLGQTLSSMLDKVQQPLLVETIKAIETAQKSNAQADIDAARVLIADMPTVWKRSYSSALDKVQNAAIANVRTLVAKAVTSGLQADLDAAKAAYENLLTMKDATVKAWVESVVKAELDAVVIVKTEVESVSAISNAKVSVALKNAVKTVEASEFKVTDKAGKALEVKSVVLSTDGKQVTLTTEAQVAYSVYTVTVNGVAKTYVALPTDSVKPTATALVTGNKQVKVQFSEKVDVATATNIANYAIDNNLTVLKAEIDAADTTGKTVLLTTAAQTVGTIYNITIQNVTDVAGNAMDKYTTMFGGMAKDSTKPTASALVTGNAEVKVVFSEKVDATVATNIANYAIDNNLVVLKAELDAADTTGATVLLTTSSQTVGTIYNITIQNVTDVEGNVMDKYVTMFGGMAKDTQKPAAPTVVVTDNNKVTVTFAEKMTKEVAENIANYAIDNNLTVLKAELDKTAKIVTLTTSAQTVGSIYTVTVQNLTDISGNVMDKATAMFGGMAKDTAAPTATVTNAANTVTVTYNEKVDATSATNVLNYVFDGDLGYATSATLDTTGKIVTLTTAAQAPGKVYNVTINGVQDLNGNLITTDTKKTFVGVGSTASSTFTLQAMSIVNVNTVDLVFDRELTAAEVTALSVAINKDNGATYSAPAGLAYTKLQQSNKKVVRLQYKTTASVNPTVFVAGHVYEATTTGSVIVTTNSANVKTFAGTDVLNAAPVATTAVALNKTAVKVTFSEPVKSVGAGEFTITKKGTSTTVAVSSVTPSSGTITEVTLNLGALLEDTAVYEITFTGTATDAAGYDTLKTTNTDASAYKVVFAGTNVVNAAPKMTAIVPVDKYTFDILFNEPVAASSLAVGDLALLNETDNSAVSLTGAVLVPSTDGTKITVKLASATSAIASGKVYKLTYTVASNHIADLQALGYDTTTDANIVKFAGTDTLNAVPEIAAVTADASTDTITVVFNEEIHATTTLDKLDFVVTVDGSTLTLTSATLDSDNKTVTIVSTTDVLAGKTGTVKVATGSDIVDVNGQAAKTDAVTFGTR